MNKQKIVNTIIVVLVVVLIITLLLNIAIYLTSRMNSTKTESRVGYDDETVRARVVTVQEEGVTTIAGKEQAYQVVEVEILEGEFSQARLSMDVGKSQIMPDEYLLDIGDTLLVNAGTNMVSGETKAFFVDFVRENAIVLIFVIFTAVAFLIGGKTGLRSLLGSMIGLGIIYLFVIPQILQGRNPLMVSIIGSALFLGLSLYIVYGWRAMTHSAVVSMVIALFLTGAFSILAVRLARLTGFGDENMMFLVQQSSRVLDMRGILLAGIIIGSLGVLDDLVVGQTSAVFQLYQTDSFLSMSELYTRSMVIGRDHVAAAVNTLILAYAGESLPMLLLFSLTEVDLRLALNVSYITEEIVQALAGTTGLFLSIPIATFLACNWVKKLSPEKVEKESDDLPHAGHHH